jgi:hypothetical protein
MTIILVEAMKSYDGAEEKNKQARTTEQDGMETQRAVVKGGGGE